MFKGSMVALVTPMDEHGEIDFPALADLVEWHINAKTDAIVAVGTTGESATLSPQEQFAIIDFVVKQAAGRIPIIAGAGTNATQTTLNLIKQAEKAKADACLLVTPYYNKPTQEGLYQHFKLLAEKTSLPIILYNVPNRTACDLLPETVGRLAQIKSIIGIKEATGQLARAQAILAQCGAGFHVFSGDDASALDLLTHGAKGVISVTANIAPQKMAELCHAVLEGNSQRALQLNTELASLHQNLFVQSNPMPVKWALHYLNKIKAGIRLPLLPLDASYQVLVKQAMQQAGVLSS